MVYTHSLRKANYKYRDTHKEHYNTKNREYARNYAKNHPDVIKNKNDTKLEFRRFLRILLEK